MSSPEADLERREGLRCSGALLTLTDGSAWGPSRATWIVVPVTPYATRDIRLAPSLYNALRRSRLHSRDPAPRLSAGSALPYPAVALTVTAAWPIGDWLAWNTPPCF